MKTPSSDLGRLPPQGEPYDGRPDLGIRGPRQGEAAVEGGGGAQAVSPESRGNLSRGVSRVTRDLASHVETMRNREPEGASLTDAQLMSADLTGVEAKMEELIQMYGHKASTRTWPNKGTRSVTSYMRVSKEPRP